MRHSAPTVSDLPASDAVPNTIKAFAKSDPLYFVLCTLFFVLCSLYFVLWAWDSIQHLALRTHRIQSTKFEAQSTNFLLRYIAEYRCCLFNNSRNTGPQIQAEIATTGSPPGDNATRVPV